MKKLMKAIAVTAAGALLCVLAVNVHAGPFGGTNSVSGTNCVGHTNGPGGSFGTNAPAEAAAHAASLYAAVFPYDVNVDAQLDSTEQTALASAIASGTFSPFGTNQVHHTPPPASASTNIAAHIAADYAVIAPFDADKNGQLDSTELASLASAIGAGTVTLPTRHSHEQDPAMAALEEQLLATYDVNGNGVLDPSEWAQIEADVKSGKLTLPGLTPPTRTRTTTRTRIRR